MVRHGYGVLCCDSFGKAGHSFTMVAASMRLKVGPPLNEADIAHTHCLLYAALEIYRRSESCDVILTRDEEIPFPAVVEK